MNFPQTGSGKSGGANSKTFVKLASGEKIKGVFRGDPLIFFQHWIGNKPFKCIGKRAGCEHCEAGVKCSFRFRINLITHEEGVWVAKIFEQGSVVYNSLKDMHENEYELDKTLVTIIRKGEKTETSYTIMPCKQNLPPVEMKKVAVIPLNELSDEKNEALPEAAPESEFQETEDDLPF